MTKQKFDIKSLRVASPCSVGWENMSGDERTRFCSACNLNVYNISEMTGAEVSALVEKTEGRICGRIFRRADGTVLTKDCPVGLRAYYKRTARFAGAALATIIGLFSINFAQDKSKKDKTCKVTSEISLLRSEIKNSANLIEGTIKDQNGAVVPGVKVILINEETKLRIETTTNDEGYYSFSDVAAGYYTFKVEPTIFKPYELTNLPVNKNEKLNIGVELKYDTTTTVTVGIIFTESYNSIDMSSSSVKYTINPRRFPD
jgi:Carboxypeptidase regulatory-like domain